MLRIRNTIVGELYIKEIVSMNIELYLELLVRFTKVPPVKRLKGPSR